MTFTAKSNLEFGNVALSDYNAFCFYKNFMDGAERDVEVISVPGRSGDLLVDNGRWRNVDVEYHIQVTDLINVHGLRAALIAELGYNKLRDNYEPNEYRIARLKEPPEIVQHTGTVAHMVVRFDCKPQRYLDSGDIDREYTANSNIFNPTNFNALPLIRVYGYGYVGIGTNTIQILQPASGDTRAYIDIDCDTQNAFEMTQSGLINRNNNIELSSGEFFYLRPGQNGISIDGDITKLILWPRWVTQ